MTAEERLKEWNRKVLEKYSNKNIEELNRFQLLMAQDEMARALITQIAVTSDYKYGK